MMIEEKKEEKKEENQARIKHEWMKMDRHRHNGPRFGQKKISNDRMKLNRSRKKGGQNLNNTFCNNNNNNKHGWKKIDSKRERERTEVFENQEC